MSTDYKHPSGPSKSNFLPTSNHSSPSPHNHSSHYPSKHKTGICQWCNKRGHTTRFYIKIANSPNVKPNANVVTIPPCQNHWPLDLGASHHITNDFSNLPLHHEYPGTNPLTVADGNTLPISLVGSTTLHSSFIFTPF